MKRAVDLVFAEDGRTRRLRFAPSATGLPDVVTLDAVSTAIHAQCGGQIGWVFLAPLPSGATEHVLVYQVRDPDPLAAHLHHFERGSIDHALDAEPPVVVRSLTRDVPSWCGRCRVSVALGRHALLDAVVAGRATIRVKSRPAR